MRCWGHNFAITWLQFTDFSGHCLHLRPQLEAFNPENLFSLLILILETVRFQSEIFSVKETFGASLSQTAHSNSRNIICKKSVGAYDPWSLTYFMSVNGATLKNFNLICYRVSS